MKESEATILLVEDKKLQVQLFMEAMAACGCSAKIVNAADGEEAQEAINNSPAPGMILLDSGIPKINGKELLKQIRKNPATRYTPVIVLTASEDPSLMREFYEQGANSYLIKPFNFDELCAMLKETSEFWLKWNKTPGKQ
jgi:two-component system, response regulator